MIKNYYYDCLIFSPRLNIFLYENIALKYYDYNKSKMLKQLMNELMNESFAILTAGLLYILKLNIYVNITFVRIKRTVSYLVIITSLLH